MSREITRQNNKQYYSVFSGKFVRRAKDGEESVERINKNSKQVKEVYKESLAGIITNLYFEPSDFGKQLKIELDPLENGSIPVLGFGVESKDGRDIMKKLPALDYSKEVEFAPYRFEEDDVARSGITLYQDGAKILNFFFDPTTKEFINGYPTIDWDSASESAQKIYKIQRDEFLMKYTEEHVISQFNQPARIPQSYEEEHAGDVIDIKDIPF